jgi:hypothetical protein
MVEDSLNKGDLECSSHFMSKCLTLYKVLEKSE